VSNWWSGNLGVFDLETTGIDVETSRIVSAHVGVIDATGASIELTEWLADPGIEIPEQASAVHGITTERARSQGRPAAEVVGEIVAALRALLERGIPVTIYNAPYDLTLLNREAVRYGVAPLIGPAPIIDPLVIDKAVDRYRKGKRTLEAAALNYGVDLTDAHDAGADAVAAGRVAQAIARKFATELGDDLSALHEQQVSWCDDQAASFEDYMRRTRDPAFTAARGWPER
jgi:DNA polymerase-3 subunit epsilon